MRQKTAPLYFCNNFVESFYIWIIIGVRIYFTLINLEQNDTKIINLLWCLHTVLWNAAHVHVLWPTFVLLRKLKRHHYCLEHLKETPSKVWKCMDQQCSAMAKHIIKCFSCLPLYQTYFPSLNRHWSIIWSVSICMMLDQSSFRRRLSSSTSCTEL